MKKALYIIVIILATFALSKTFDTKTEESLIHVSSETTEEVLVVEKKEVKEETKVESKPQKLVYVKYRETGPVNVNDPSFEYQNTSRSSFVGGAWYDKSEGYMVIKLKSTYYHYCDLPSSIWDSFKQTTSFGDFYDNRIQGSYSCRYKDTPSYSSENKQDPELTQEEIQTETTSEVITAKPQKINAVCGESYSCKVGNVTISNQNSWTCAGLNGGSSAYCSKPEPAQEEIQEKENENQGCFIAGTQILLPDGTTKSIEDINPEEEIMSSSGPLQVMKKYEISYEGLLYSVNGSELFVSDSHPFMTTEGWKSFDPEKTKIESPTLEVNQLEIGDILIKENGEQEELKEFYSEFTTTTVYNFSLNGTKDFYADGYLVHNVNTDILGAAILTTSNAKA